MSVAMRQGLLGLVLVALLQCRSNGPRDYFPLATGHRWYYVLSDEGEQAEVMVQVAEKTGDEYALRQEILTGYLEISFPFILDEDVYFASSDSGVIREGNEPFLLLKSPLEVGAEWLNGGDTVRITDKVTISVPAGNFADCYRVSYHPGGDQTTVWYAPDVGIVRILEYDSVEAELLSTNF
jgi:hypothetical protein